MKRRDLLRLGGAALVGASGGRMPFKTLVGAQTGMTTSPVAPPGPEDKADYTLRIAPVTVETGPVRHSSPSTSKTQSPGGQ